MKLLIRDDYFDGVDEIRDTALNLDYICSEDVVIDVGWRGYRTEELDSFSNQFFDDIAEEVKNDVATFFEVDQNAYSITSYFHIAYNRTVHTRENFYTTKYHTDPQAEFAGIVYLHPNPPNPENTGTSILDGFNNKMINVKNVYNRLVAYRSDQIHAPSNLFGEVPEDGRLTFTFFMDKNWTWEPSNVVEPSGARYER